MQNEEVDDSHCALLTRVLWPGHPPPTPDERKEIRAGWIDKNGKVKRPSNCFILYRSNAGKSIRGKQGPKSIIIADDWEIIPHNVKVVWKRLARKCKRLHRELFPDYRYSPARIPRDASDQTRLPDTITPPFRTERKKTHPSLKNRTHPYPHPSSPRTQCTPAQTRVSGASHASTSPPLKTFHRRLTGKQDGDEELDQALLPNISSDWSNHTSLFFGYNEFSTRFCQQVHQLDTSSLNPPTSASSMWQSDSPQYLMFEDASSSTLSPSSSMSTSTSDFGQPPNSWLPLANDFFQWNGSCGVGSSSSTLSPPYDSGGQHQYYSMY